MRAPAGAGLSANLEAPLVMLAGGPAQVYADAAGGPVRLDLIHDAEQVVSRPLTNLDAAFEGLAAFGGEQLHTAMVQVTAQGRRVVHRLRECR